MPRRHRRPARLVRPALAAGAVVLLTSLTACGGGSGSDSSSAGSGSSSSASSSSSSSSESALGAVSFSGEVGKSLSATWKSTLKAPSSTQVTTLVKGDGSEIKQGDTVSAYLYLGDATTKKDAFNGYQSGSGAQSIPVNGQVGPVFSKMFEGATYGSRVAAVTTPKELFGSAGGNPQLGVGANDTLVVVADLVSKVAVAATPSDTKAHDVSPSELPKVVESKGTPTGLDFSGIKDPSPETPVQRVILKKGTGPAVKASDTLTVNYLGEVYDADKPFDESYTSQPLVSPLSGLIQGWSIGLTGVPVGSRVLLQIPPAFGYGAQGSGSSIPGNATLWFVIDVVKAQ